MRASRGELLAARFWSRVRITDGCWEWTANHLPAGYGLVKAEGRSHLAHRVSWELAHGPIPAGMLVLHRCDNPACVRPDHLWLGTQKQNIADMLTKGRGLTPAQQATIKHPSGADHWTHRHPELVPSGDNHWRKRNRQA